MFQLESRLDFFTIPKIIPETTVLSPHFDDDMTISKFCHKKNVFTPDLETKFAKIETNGWELRYGRL